jgi:hypothetical protein
MKLLKFIEFDTPLLEKSIGSEEIRKKWYPNLDKKIFYKLVNIDPTSVRKKDFSKPGKYTKWIIAMYKKMNEQNYFEDDSDFDRYFNSEKYQNSNLINDLKLQEINIVIFPDWSVDEDNLGWELQQVIQILANHKSKITLLIDVGDTSAEEADIVLAAIAMNLMM